MNMKNNTELVLEKVVQTERWEDQEKSSNDVEALRAEFRQRLYADEATPAVKPEATQRPEKK